MQATTQTSRLAMQRIHGVLPYVLTVVFAGLGHLYRQRWRRGAAWFGLYTFTLVALSTYTFAARPFVVSVLGGELSAMDVAFPGAILLLCLADLYLLERAE